MIEAGVNARGVSADILLREENTMRKFMNVLLMVFAVGVAGFAVTGCSDDGPAEKAGEKFDQAVEDTKDAFDNDGPAENAGEEIDDAFDGEDN